MRKHCRSSTVAEVHRGVGLPAQLLWDAPEQGVPDLAPLRNDKATWERLRMHAMREGSITFFLEPGDSRVEEYVSRALEACERCVLPC
jgi:hypothetical protein